MSDSDPAPGGGLPGDGEGPSARGRNWIGRTALVGVLRTVHICNVENPGVGSTVSVVVGALRRIPKFLLVGLALSLGLAACSSSPSTSTSTTSSSASTTSSSTSISTSTSAPTVATGSITCSGTGTVTFDPPLRKGGKSPETVTIAIAASTCTTSGSNVSKVTGASSTLTIHLASNACAALKTSNPAGGHPTWTARWTPSSIASSTVTFSGHAIESNRAGDVGFVFPNSGGTASVTGSFAGSDHGALSSAAAYTDMTEQGVRNTCKSLGLPRLTGTGTVKLS